MLEVMIPAYFEWTSFTGQERTRERFAEFFRVLSPDGALAISLSMMENGNDIMGTFSRVVYWMRRIGAETDSQGVLPVEFFRRYDLIARVAIAALTPRTKAPLL